MASSPAVGTGVDLSRFFRPRSIAVVGAHDQREPLANMTARLRDKAAAVGGTVHYVNPRRDTVFGQPTYPSVVDVPGEVDVMVVMIGDAIAAVEDAIPKRPRFTVVFSGGYEEVGPDGAVRSQQLLDAVRRAGTRLVGPNTNINSLEVLADLPPPKIGLASQSGMQGRPLAQAQDLGVALSYWATTGNETDLEVSDFLKFFARDDETRAVAAYVEGFRDGDRFRAAALAALEQDTPIVLIKVGRSAVGSTVARSHTGHLVGSDAVHDALFRQYGVTRVDDIDELIEVSMVLARSGVPPADGLGLFCVSGGTAAHLSDLVGAAGLPLPALSDATQQGLRDIVGPAYMVANPVDNGGGSMLRGHGPAMAELMLGDPAVGILLVPITGVFADLTQPMVETLVHARQVSDKPIIAIWSGPTTNEAHQQILDAGVPVVRNLRNALTAARALLERGARQRGFADFIEAARRLPALAATDADRGESRLLDEAESAAWLGARGVPYVRHRAVATVPEAVAAAGEIGWPVVLKARGAALAHKSDAGLVALDLASPEDVERAAKEMQARAVGEAVDGWLVAEQVQGGVELLVGVSRDPAFGPVVAVGLGGVQAEAHRDVAMCVLPLTRERAHAMLDELRGAALLDGWRGAPPVDREAVVDVLVALAEAALDPALDEVDVNPLVAGPSGAVGVDALVRLTTPPGSAG